MRASQSLAITFAEPDELDLALPIAVKLGLGVSREIRRRNPLTLQALPLLPQ